MNRPPIPHEELAAMPADPLPVSEHTSWAEMFATAIEANDGPAALWALAAGGDSMNRSRRIRLPQRLSPLVVNALAAYADRYCERSVFPPQDVAVAIDARHAADTLEDVAVLIMSGRSDATDSRLRRILLGPAPDPDRDAIALGCVLSAIQGYRHAVEPTTIAELLRRGSPDPIRDALRCGLHAAALVLVEDGIRSTVRRIAPMAMSITDLDAADVRRLVAVASPCWIEDRTVRSIARCRYYDATTGSDTLPSIAADQAINSNARLLAWLAAWELGVAGTHPCPPIPPHLSGPVSACAEAMSARRPADTLALFAAIGAATTARTRRRRR